MKTKTRNTLLISLIVFIVAVITIYRYMDDTVAMQVLLDIAKLKVGTADEILANEFVAYFANTNGIDIGEASKPSGALTIEINQCRSLDNCA